MNASKTAVFYVKYICKSSTLSDIEVFHKLIKNKKILILKAVTLTELQLLSELIFGDKSIEIVGKIELSWSWRHFKKVWTVKLKKIN